MANITITINTDNAAFEDDPHSEVASILESIASDMRDERDMRWSKEKIRDSNGNTCGSITMGDE